MSAGDGSKTIDEMKQKAADAALALVRSDTILGLGSGSTAALFIRSLGQALANGTLTNITGLPTSRASADLAKEAGIPLTDFATAERCALTIDGADEIDDDLRLIKGLGGALLREKLVAQNSDVLVIIADDSKRVTKLGTNAPLPVEVTPFGHAATRRFLADIGDPKLRGGDADPYVTDNGNLIYDVHFANGIADATPLAAALSARAGIVEHGLFLGLADKALVATAEGVLEL